ncbi:putative sulfate exporter family transporter [Cellulomonas shaoxiangyii]|uniref:Putative sulfate exporter family transporter n=1 Tax=Cellulomonas shaoxiangyii TaxID=2566013 RepID=A0A4P7SQS9_9CELL|nr:putative sulfate exporter family transporter [Cellulomonas shaoxiangyii]TGY85957.1 putative sulfate exporter family transporter [Cellulomonas shaoxiangyii]
MPGVAVALGLGAAGAGLGASVPLLGGAVLALALGVALRELLSRAPGAWAQALEPGARACSAVALQAAVVLLGFGLSLRQVAQTGGAALPVMAATLTVVLLVAALLGRRLGLDGETRTLIGVGTGICGASAIAATSAVIRASQPAITTAMATIFTFNVLGAVTFPLLGRAMGLSQEGFGTWAGTAVNDTSSVVAAATAYGALALETAVVVKLTRTLAIVPVTLALAVRQGRRDRAAADATAGRTSWTRLVPPFLVLFVAASAVTTLGWFPAGWESGADTGAHALTAVALAGVGLLTPVDALRRAGWRPLALGGALSVAVAVTSLAVQAATGLL